ncbi:hypothetical protein CBR_g34494 [Chara braunii]|uniref:Uncharacterized protein n=1 Tax=Chara braunii TaxID=69332 RepID=A0A388LJ15_CHABU|nr:hypothetical protein CBR_g34494 [Chara braunii]|eukprot:GBG82212.1 hypothetical protein CBR_g34494 [Chara braunii]
MTRAEFKELRNQENDRTFWVIVVQVPLDDMPFIYVQIERAIGKIERAFPPDADSERPALVNAKFDLDPAAKNNMKDRLWIATSKGDKLEVRLACFTAIRCRICKQFFHTEADCKRNGGVQSREPRGGANNANQQPTQTQSNTRQQESRGPRYQGPLGPQSSWNVPGASQAQTGFLNAVVNPIYSPGGQLNASLSMQNWAQMMAALHGVAMQAGAPVQGSNWQYPNFQPNAQQSNAFSLGGGGLHMFGQPAQGIPSTFQTYHPGLGNPDPRAHQMGGDGRGVGAGGTGRQASGSQQTLGASPQPGRREGSSQGRDVHGQGAAAQEASTSRVSEGSQHTARHAGKQRRLSMSSVKELHTEASGDSLSNPNEQLTSTGTPGQKTTRDRRVTSLSRGQGAGIEQLVIPLVCIAVRNAFWVIIWQSTTGPPLILLRQVADAPTPQIVAQVVENLYLKYFATRVVADCPMARIITEVNGNKIKIFVPLIDARMTSDDMGNLEQRRLRLVPMAWFAEGKKLELGKIMIATRLSVECLAELKIHFHKDKHLDSQFVRVALTLPWDAEDLGRGASRSNTGAPHIQFNGGLRGDG